MVAIPHQSSEGDCPLPRPGNRRTPITRTGVPQDSLPEVLQSPTSVGFFLLTSLGQTIPSPPPPPPHRECFVSLESVYSMRACAHVRVYVCVYVRVSVIKTLNQLNNKIKLKNSKNFVAKTRFLRSKVALNLVCLDKVFKLFFFRHTS